MARVSSQESPDPAASGPARTGYAQIDTSVPHPARRYNYLLGGKDNFAADRAAGDDLARMFPTVRLAAVENRRFLQRATRFLTEEAGIRQFLDIGTGLPTADNTHEVAQRIARESRVVYVDNDPMVMAHARALLTSTPEGRTTYLEDDLRRPADILARRELRDTLDLSKPVGLMLIAVLHFIPDADDPYAVVARLMDAVPSGSYLVIAHAAADIAPEASAEMARRYNQMASATVTPRTRDQVARFFTGLDLLPPGLIPINQWALTGHIDATTGALVGYSAIARKP